MVSKASDDLPDPDSPVKTTSLSRGMVRSTFWRLCSRAPLITMWVCCDGPGGLAPPRPSGMDSLSSPVARPGKPGLGRGGRRKRLAVLHGVATQPDQPVPQLRRALELQVAGSLLHLPLQVLDQALDLVRRQPRGQRGDSLLHHRLPLA